MTNNFEEKLTSLMRGLQLPDLEIWAEQPEEAYYMLGALIALKAGGAKKELVQKAEKKLESLIIDPNEPKIVLLN